jgi:hypothetical protein
VAASKDRSGREGQGDAAARRRAQVMKVLTHKRVRQTPVARRTAGARTVLIQPGIAERVELFPGHRYRLATGARAAHPDYPADLAAADAIVGGPFALTQGARR